MTLLLGCATGGRDPGGQQPVDAAPSGTDAGQIGLDAPPVVPIDAPPMVPIDAPPMVPIDAPPMMPPDAAPGLFCTANNQCTTAGECCITLGGPMGFCGPGTVIFGACVPF